AGIGAGRSEEPAAARAEAPAPAETSALAPLEIVDLYLRAMAARDARRDLPFYSAATARMLQGSVMTPAQMENVARTYRSCAVDVVRVHDNLAVVRYRVEQRTCAPYFLRREGGAWTLDLTMMASAIGFNHENYWHFRTPISHAYEFGFEDWRFDANGFPTRPGN